MEILNPLWFTEVRSLIYKFRVFLQLTPFFLFPTFQLYLLL